MRVGVVGLGAIGSLYARILQDLGVGILSCDHDPERGEFRELSELLIQKPDALIVCTPPSEHREAVEAALTAGVPVLCEKPMGLTPAEVRSMTETSRATGTLLMPSAKYLFLEEVRQARRLLQEGTIGQPLCFHNRFVSRLDMTERWNSDPSRSGGGVIADAGTHSLDLIRFLLGPVRSVTAASPHSVQKLRVEDTAFLLFRCDEVVGSVELSWSVAAPTRTYLEVTGSTGLLQLGWQGSAYRSGASDWVPFGDPYSKMRCLRGQLEHFLACAQGKATPLLSGEEALASAQVLAAAYRALQDGGTHAI